MNLPKRCACELPQPFSRLSVFSFSVSLLPWSFLQLFIFTFFPLHYGISSSSLFHALNCLYSNGSNTYQSFASACRRLCVCDRLYSPCSDSWRKSPLCGFDISVPDKLGCHPCLFHYSPLGAQVCRCNLVCLYTQSSDPICQTSQPEEGTGGVFWQTCNEALLQTSWKALHSTMLSKLFSFPSFCFSRVSCDLLLE